MVKQCTYTLTNTYIDGYGVIEPSEVIPEDKPENPNLPANKGYTPPAKENNSSLVNISTLFESFEELERLAIEYDQNNGLYASKWFPTECILAYLKYYDYHNIFFELSTGFNVDNFVNYVITEKPELHKTFEPYISEDRNMLRDDLDGVIDLAHLAATIGGYSVGGLAVLPGRGPAYSGWAGDVATGILDLHRANPSNYQEWADAKFGSTEISCNYSDLCADSDAVKIAELLKADSNHSFSKAIKEYYTDWYDCRYSYLYGSITTDIFGLFSRELSAENFTLKVLDYFYSTDGIVTLMLMKEAYLDREAVVAGCTAFTKYLYYRLYEE